MWPVKSSFSPAMVRSVRRSSRRALRSAGVNTAAAREPSGSATSGAVAAPAGARTVATAVFTTRQMKR